MKTAESLNDLALVYRRQGRYDESVRYHARALAIRERLLGIQHPSVAQSLSNIAQIYMLQEKKALLL